MLEKVTNLMLISILKLRDTEKRKQFHNTGWFSFFTRSSREFKWGFPTVESRLEGNDLGRQREDKETLHDPTWRDEWETEGLQWSNSRTEPIHIEVTASNMACHFISRQKMQTVPDRLQFLFE